MGKGIFPIPNMLRAVVHKNGSRRPILMREGLIMVQRVVRLRVWLGLLKKTRNDHFSMTEWILNFLGKIFVVDEFAPHVYDWRWRTGRNFSMRVTNSSSAMYGYKLMNLWRLWVPFYESGTEYAQKPGT